MYLQVTTPEAAKQIRLEEITDYRSSIMSK
jgi:hypothetical protein